MAWYVFRCGQCGKELDVQFPIKDFDSLEIPKCPKCKAQMELQLQLFHNGFTPTRNVE